MASANSYVCIINDSQRKQLEELLTSRGWEFSEIPYAYWKAKDGKVNAVAYKSGKLTVQGVGTEDFVLYTLEPEILHTVGFGYEDSPALLPEITPHGGIDESGKGDFFGPLAVAGVCVDKESAVALAAAGCKDSKLIKSDKQITAIASAIRKAVPGRYEVLVLMPETYNRLYARIGNLNRLLAWGHARIIENLLESNPECPRMLSDKFGSDHLIKRALMTRGKNIKLEQMVRAESDIAVAAASILARDAFIKGMKKLSDTVGVELPRGAGSGVMKCASDIFEKQGQEKLATLVKTHFKCWNEVTGILPEVDNNEKN